MPRVIIIGGPNGAGKTTSAPRIVQHVSEGAEFVNADLIAQGLSSLNPTSVSFAAGRLTLARIKELIISGKTLAFETTLASRSFVPLLANAKKGGYSVTLVYLWLSSPLLAIARVKKRARYGGHSIPEEVIRRRYDKGLRNLFQLYLPLADEWQVYDNSSADPVIIAERIGSIEQVFVHDSWEKIMQMVR